MAILHYIHDATPLEDTYEKEKESPQETDTWFKPFHEAVAKGLVDGRKTQGARTSTGGVVSE